ncbi:hypothetical protein SLS62_009239 [Diatrype stigma]|uniref:N-acetyltransferase domain-containing protein n=1 Tax=Diatrype stigma TaxID=117547 RepID=A0AAN9UQH2_9PEZI
MAFIRPYRESDFEACANICIATLPPSLASGLAKEEVARLSPYLWTHPYTHLSPGTCHVLDDGAGNAVGYCIGCPDVHAFVAGYGGYVSAVLAPRVQRPAQLETREPFWISSSSPSSSSPPPPPNTNTIPQEQEGGLLDGGDDGKKKRKKMMMANPTAMAQLAYRADWMIFDDDGEYEDKDGDDHGDGETAKGRSKKKMSKAELARRWRATMHIDILPGWQGQGWGRRLIEAFAASVRASGADYGEGEHIGVAGDNRKVLGFYRQLGFRVVQDEGEGGDEDGDGEDAITLVKDIERS